MRVVAAAALAQLVCTTTVRVDPDDEEGSDAAPPPPPSSGGLSSKLGEVMKGDDMPGIGDMFKGMGAGNPMGMLSSMVDPKELEAETAKSKYLDDDWDPDSPKAKAEAAAKAAAKKAVPGKQAAGLSQKVVNKAQSARNVQRPRTPMLSRAQAPAQPVQQMGYQLQGQPMQSPQYQTPAMPMGYGGYGAQPGLMQAGMMMQGGMQGMQGGMQGMQGMQGGMQGMQGGMQPGMMQGQYPMNGYGGGFNNGMGQAAAMINAMMLQQQAMQQAAQTLEAQQKKEADMIVEQEQQIVAAVKAEQDAFKSAETSEVTVKKDTEEQIAVTENGILGSATGAPSMIQTGKDQQTKTRVDPIVATKAAALQQKVKELTIENANLKETSKSHKGRLSRLQAQLQAEQRDAAAREAEATRQLAELKQ
mmetsp:Transcript_10812/g.23891  ORF Transcript_10812/g.23891 Transcript_10812/m.23891 type:complete len:417 (+) Transcript_10812:98-1348(+)